MELEQARLASKQLKIDITQVVREFWETVVLKELFESPTGKFLIFKGGTALRLVYGSPRFSEDLDFSLTADELSGTFASLMRKVISNYAELTISDMTEKHFTYLCEIKVTQGYLPAPFRIKVEISKRREAGYRFVPALISSPLSAIQCLGNIAVLEQLYRDKSDCAKERAKPKDYFDLWYICQKLDRDFEPPKTGVSAKALKRDLRKFLPRDFWPAIEVLSREIG